ncbi:MAG: hypothetical protein WDN24_05530 [Sphingomonas sp.]
MRGVSGELRGGFATGAVAHRFVLGGDVSFTHQRGLRDGVVPPRGRDLPDARLPGEPITRWRARSSPTRSRSARSRSIRRCASTGTTSIPRRTPLLPSFNGAAQSGSRLSPKLGAVVKLTRALRLFGSYARASRRPRRARSTISSRTCRWATPASPTPICAPRRAAASKAACASPTPSARST